MTLELLDVSGEGVESVASPAAPAAPVDKKVEPAPHRLRIRTKRFLPNVPAEVVPPAQAVPATAAASTHAASEAPEPELSPQEQPSINTAALAPAPRAHAGAGTPRSDVRHSPERDAYYRMLRAAVELHRSYPRVARRARLQGTVVVRMSVSRAGRLLAARVTRSSSEAVLDDAALSAVRSAATLPVAPTAIENDPVTVDMPFVFSLQ